MLRQVANLTRLTPYLSHINPSFAQAKQTKPTKQPTQNKKQSKQTVAPAPEQKQLKLADKPYFIPSETLKKQMPQLYQTLSQQADALQKSAVENHQWKLRQIKKRIDKDSITRLQKINQILNGLTQSQKQYLKMKIVRKVQNFE